MLCITKDMIANGLKRGIIKPELDGELVAYIGDNWFYFGGHEFEYTDPKDIPFDILVNEIFECLDDFKNVDALEDEYWYYYSFIIEHIKDISIQVGKCNKCGGSLYFSDTDEYVYQCCDCDEDFYAFEQW